MEIIKENQEVKLVLTRAEKVGRMKEIIKNLLKERDYKWNELLEAGVKAYAERFPEDAADMNDVRGRCGSTFDLLEQAGEAVFKDNVCSLVKKEEPKKATRGRKKSAEQPEATEEKPKKTTRTKKAVEETAATVEEKPKKTTRGRKKTEEQPEPTEEKPKKTTKTKKAVEEKAAETPAPVVEVKPVVAEKTEEKKPVEKKAEKQEEVKAAEAKTPVFDMTLLLGEKTAKKPVEPKNEPKRAAAEGTPMPVVKAAEKPVEKPAEKPVEKKPTAMPEFSFLGNAGLKQEKATEKKAVEQKPVERKEVEKKPVEVKPAEKKPVENKTAKPTARENVRRTQSGRGNASKTLSPDEALKAGFIKRLRGLGGDYFEYYSVYLLERYSLRNGRRLESLKVSGGDRDGGIDGEITLTDKFGFRETIYIQAKNWDDTRGNPEKWTVGETYLQQFIGAVACRQAKEGIQHCRGIYVTTSHFTEEAKKALDAMSDKFVGYDADELFDAAKECSFGLKKENGEWKIDEKLLSGEKAFFSLY